MNEVNSQTEKALLENARRVPVECNLIQQVGGLEAAKQIVAGAPEVATHYETDDTGFYYYKREPFRSSVWIDDYWQSLFNDFDVCSQRYIDLSDLRAAIAETGFKVGDWVVPKNDAVNAVSSVRNVLEIDGNQILINLKGSARSFWRKCEDWRTATPAEIAAGRRLDSQSNIDVRLSTQSHANSSVVASTINIEPNCKPAIPPLNHMQFCGQCARYAEISHRNINRANFNCALAALFLILGVVGWLALFGKLGWL